MKTFFRQNIAPFLVLLVFLVALIATSARIFLPSDMIAPAPIDEPTSQIERSSEVAGLPPSLKVLVHGIPANTL
ncbi:hypothetical protein H6F67_06120 [Microcoleus sp. FACHB-1515]|uniref:hypothetical protein n=1 Tax=Cyanophyceae TaxID=3028117 RepID=UPI00168221DB|nr:hypothetical protein [Microcoleus sp. FACHB-1515]MBD2089426.1 hypothetical protein [Microcoleus sp. FACHB-1515]